MIPGAQKSFTSPSTIATNTTKPSQKTLVPIPQNKPTKKPVVIDSTTGLKSSYAVVYTGK